MAYAVDLTPAARRELRKLDPGIQRRLVRAILELERDPRPSGTKALGGGTGMRLRVGIYRILYEVDDLRKRVVIFRVGHRREIYRNL